MRGTVFDLIAKEGTRIGQALDQLRAAKKAGETTTLPIPSFVPKTILSGRDKVSPTTAAVLWVGGARHVLDYVLANPEATLKHGIGFALRRVPPPKAPNAMASELAVLLRRYARSFAESLANRLEPEQFETVTPTGQSGEGSRDKRLKY
jgi:hypothetical protein